MNGYQQSMVDLNNLSACMLLTTGRTGSDFLQSLLDGHPQVLTFNGEINIHEFWSRSRCVAAGRFTVEDLIEEFIGKYIHKFKSRYDIMERKDQLGEDRNQTIDIDLPAFRLHMTGLFEGREPTARNFLLAVYGAYALCLGQDLSIKTLLFHHEHHAELADGFVRDFPETRILFTIRDPRASFVSGIENWRRYTDEADRGLFLEPCLRRVLRDCDDARRFGCDYRAVRVEDMGEENIRRELAGWLGINFDPAMNRSTWAGLLWHGDRLSAKAAQDQGLSRNILNNRWQERLGTVDKFLFNYLLEPRLKHYGYPYQPAEKWTPFLAAALIAWPLSCEWRYWSPGYLAGCLRKGDARRIGSNSVYYFKRVGLFLKYYVKRLRRNYTLHPFLKVRQTEPAAVSPANAEVA